MSVDKRLLPLKYSRSDWLTQLIDCSELNNLRVALVASPVFNCGIVLQHESNNWTKSHFKFPIILCWQHDCHCIVCAVFGKQVCGAPAGCTLGIPPLGRFFPFTHRRPDVFFSHFPEDNLIETNRLIDPQRDPSLDKQSVQVFVKLIILHHIYESHFPSAQKPAGLLLDEFWW